MHRRAVCFVSGRAHLVQPASSGPPTTRPSSVSPQQVTGRERDAGEADGTPCSPAPVLAGGLGQAASAFTPTAAAADLADVAHAPVHHQPLHPLAAARTASRPPSSAQRREPPPSTTSTRPRRGLQDPPDQRVVLEHPDRLDPPGEGRRARRSPEQRLGDRDPVAEPVAEVGGRRHATASSDRRRAAASVRRGSISEGPDQGRQGKDQEQHDLRRQGLHGGVDPERRDSRRPGDRRQSRRSRPPAARRSRCRRRRRPCNRGTRS